MDGDVKVEESTRNYKPPPEQVACAACVVRVLDAVVELLAMEEVVEQLFASVALHCTLTVMKLEK